MLLVRVRLFFLPTKIYRPTPRPSSTQTRTIRLEVERKTLLATIILKLFSSRSLAFTHSSSMSWLRLYYDVSFHSVFFAIQYFYMPNLYNWLCVCNVSSGCFVGHKIWLTEQQRTLIVVALKKKKFSLFLRKHTFNTKLTTKRQLKYFSRIHCADREEKLSARKRHKLYKF